MMKRSGHQLFAIFFLVSALVRAADYSGIVIDAQTKKPIMAVNIYLKNSNIGTTSDLDGHFTINNKSTDGILVFRHIAYENFEMPFADLKAGSKIELVPSVIETEGIRVESEHEPIRIIRDIPQTYRIIESETFEARGYIDAGDLLKAEQSIQIEEELSGKKTISIRSGNADDVIVLYNGIKMNNAYDNTFDLSLLNLDDVQHIEVIKGSNSSLYGSEGFSGMINVVPKIERDYYAKFQQQFGSYNSGVWNLQLNYSLFNRLNVSYTQKRGGAQRHYENSAEHVLDNDVVYHSAHVLYDFSEQPGENRLGLIYFRTNNDFNNTRHSESQQKQNEMTGLSYTGKIGRLRHLHVVAGLQKLETTQNIWLQPDFVNRHADNESWSFNIDKRFVFQQSDILIGYQFEDATLDFADKRQVAADIPLGIEAAELLQHKHGFVAIAKYHAPTTSPSITAMDFDASLRHDIVNNDVRDSQMRDNTDNPILADVQGASTKDWDHTTLKFSSRLAGEVNDFFTDIFFNSGTNVKFPSLFQQLSTPLAYGEGAEYIHPQLSPEVNNSLELGVKTRRSLNIDRVDEVQFQLNYFQNNYTNKFRMYYLQSIPMAFFDNVAAARISGFEVSGEALLFNRRVTTELAVSRYNVSSKDAFPFKSDLKVVFNLGYAHKGSAIQLHAFFENEQIGWVRDVTGQFYQIILESHANMDIHASQSFHLGPVKSYITASVRNLFDEDTTLEGIAIRDRRIYVTFGVQY